MTATQLRNGRDALLADLTIRGRAFGQALAQQLDDALRALFAELDVRVPVSVVALGSYGRGEMCPGSDVDVLLVHDAKGRKQGSVKEMAEKLWYPLWDAGFVTGHGARTVKDSLLLADEDLDAMTALLEVRHVAGDESLSNELCTRARELAVKRQGRVLRDLADGAELRRVRPGPVAEVLEPDLKDGAGGLRDIQALGWAGDALGGAGLVGLITRGFVGADDAARLEAARAMLLNVRVALHRATSGRSDRLALQEQDAVAELIDAGTADDLVRELAGHARHVAWIARDVWMRVRDHLAGPAGRTGRGERALAEGVVLRDGRVVLTDSGPVTALHVLEGAAAAADASAPFERSTLGRLAAMDPPTWDVWERAAFLRLLRAGDRAVPVFEALDYEGVLVRLMPEWEHVRSRPQRNAYHRFTVDRHLLEAVAECAALLDDGDAEDPSFDGNIARACRRPELLLLGALLHDIGKGLPGDHSDVGAEKATAFTRRIGLDSEGREIVAWLVRNHLLMADTAVRRDLSDAAVADNLAAQCAADPERLRLLYLLTIGDSRATGPAAWGSSKAALLRDLFVKAAAAIDRGAADVVAGDRREALAVRMGVDAAHAHLERLPDSYVLAFDDDDMAGHAELFESATAAPESAAIRCRHQDGNVTITVVAADRPRLLATLAGALAVSGLDVLEANLFGTTDGLALDVFRAGDPFGRVADDVGRVERTLRGALAGEFDVGRRVADRRRDYQRRDAEPGPIAVDVDVNESATDTLVEVHTDDEIGLLHNLAETLADLGLDVRLAKVHTLGSRVVDVFYVRDAAGGKIEDLDAIGKMRAALVERLRA